MYECKESILSMEFVASLYETPAIERYEESQHGPYNNIEVFQI